MQITTATLRHWRKSEFDDIHTCVFLPGVFYRNTGSVWPGNVVLQGWRSHHNKRRRLWEMNFYQRIMSRRRLQTIT